MLLWAHHSAPLCAAILPVVRPPICSPDTNFQMVPRNNSFQWRKKMQFTDWSFETKKNVSLFYSSGIKDEKRCVYIYVVYMKFIMSFIMYFLNVWSWGIFYCCFFCSFSPYLCTVFHCICFHFSAVRNKEPSCDSECVCRGNNRQKLNTNWPPLWWVLGPKSLMYAVI